MTEESEHYMDRPKVHKSLETSLGPEPDTRDKTYYKAWATQSNHCDLPYRSRAHHEIYPSTRTLMAALREIVVGQCAT
jgi:hypothetical protein